MAHILKTLCTYQGRFKKDSECGMNKKHILVNLRKFEDEDTLNGMQQVLGVQVLGV